MILSLIQLLLHKHGKARNQATINEHIQNDKACHFITTPSGMLINFLAITMKNTKVPNLAVVSKLFINSMPA